jgi:hypothetical protein
MDTQHSQKNAKKLIKRKEIYNIIYFLNLIKTYLNTNNYNKKLKKIIGKSLKTMKLPYKIAQ